MSEAAQAHQTLPTRWEAREVLRDKGQFWTPAWVAEAMVAYVTGGGATTLFDPAVGAGAFFRAAKQVEKYRGQPIVLRGSETDPLALHQAQATGLSPADLAGVLMQDFTTFQPDVSLPAIVANPPYIRHHRLDRATKDRLRQDSTRITGFVLDGRAGYHVYFLVHALSLLAPEGRLAFILPADTFEGVFAAPLWQWVTARFHLEAVVTFAPAATPFPGVDTNAVVVLIKNAAPQKLLRWARVETVAPDDLARWVRDDFAAAPPSLCCTVRSVAEACQTGLSRPALDSSLTVGGGEPVLGDYARVCRGIATGANEFFFLTSAQVREHNLPCEFLLRAVGRTRDIDAEIITPDTLRALDEKGRPTHLLSVGRGDMASLPLPLAAYLEQGAAHGIPERTLIKTRRPWYKMETRPVPPFLFAYLGRRNTRFIRNEAQAMPLTGFLCVYPHHTDAGFVDKLWQVLRHEQTAASLLRVGKSYGDGAVKVEPRALERLPLPAALVEEAGLVLPRLFSVGK